MNIRKFTLPLLLIIPLLAVASWFFFYEGTDNKARRAFDEGRLEDASKELEASKEKTSSAEYELHKGYIEREKGNLGSSKAALEEALGGEPAVRLKEEILINQAYNSFVGRDSEGLQKALKGLEKLRSKWVPFFNVLSLFQRNSNAANLAKLENTPIPSPLSSWMAKAFSHSFTPYWFGKQNALALIDEGNTVQARQQLEKISSTAEGGEKKQILYLIGLSYLKEAGERPQVAATPYYKLAVSYFKKVPISDDNYQKEREGALEQIHKQVNALIDDDQFNDFPFYAAVVEEWGTNDGKKELAAKLASLIRQQGTSKDLIDALSLLKSQTQFQAGLQEEILKEIQNNPFANEFTASVQDTPENLAWDLTLQQFYVERAQGELSKGMTQEAEMNLKAALALGSPLPLSLKEILPISAQIFLQKQDPYDAVLAWNKYFALQPVNALERVKYGQALMEVLRYDMASKQFLFMEQNAHLSNDEGLLFIKSLLLSGNFEEAKIKALEITPKLNGDEAFKLMSIVVPLNDKTLNEMLAKQIPAKEKWNDETKLAAFETALDKGDYDQAARLFAAEKSLLNKTGAGKFLIARFYSQIGNQKTALKYAQEAYQKEPTLLKLIAFIEQHTLDAKGIKQQLERIEKEIQTDPQNLYSQLEKGQVLIDLSIALQEKSNLPIAKMPELRSAYALLQELAPKGVEFPLYHFLYGLSSFLLDDDSSASEALKKALELYPGYGDAAKYLALVYSKEGKSDEAVRILTNTLKFHPTDAEAWQVLADIYSAAGEGLEAVNALDNALRYRPNNINTLLSAAKYKLELQNPEAAQALVEKALKLNPQNQTGLVIFLQILNNPLLTEHTSFAELRKKSEETLAKLRKVNPAQADKLQKELNL